ncbi:major capsid protein P2 [Asticcacaulis sp.]|uniref:major capsid protein P2 n=1 Tax=Asticcacaulis sp. TaxID=1872648 RepID=UPI0026296E0E|nr:major capsid protein P2 [Asticcacaulis sp.]
MLHRPMKLPSFSAVQAGATASLNLPVGPTYRQLALLYKKAGVNATEAQMATDLIRIRLKINGSVRFDISAADYINLIKDQGFTINAGELPIFLSRPTARTPQLEEDGAWGTANVATFTLEVDIVPGAGVVTLDGVAWTTADRRPLNGIIQTLPFTYQAATSGQVEIPTLPRGNGDLWALYLFTSNMTAFEMEIDGVKISDAPMSFITNSRKWTGRVPQAGLFVFEPTWLDRGEDRIPLAGAQDFRLKLTMSAAETIRIYMDTVIAPLGIVVPRAA